MQLFYCERLEGYSVNDNSGWLISSSNSCVNLWKCDPLDEPYNPLQLTVEGRSKYFFSVPLLSVLYISSYPYPSEVFFHRPTLSLSHAEAVLAGRVASGEADSRGGGEHGRQANDRSGLLHGSNHILPREGPSRHSSLLSHLLTAHPLRRAASRLNSIPPMFSASTTRPCSL